MIYDMIHDNLTNYSNIKPLTTLSQPHKLLHGGCNLIRPSLDQHVATRGKGQPWPGWQGKGHALGSWRVNKMIVVGPGGKRRDICCMELLAKGSVGVESQRCGTPPAVEELFSAESLVEPVHAGHDKASRGLHYAGTNRMLGGTHKAADQPPRLDASMGIEVCSRCKQGNASHVLGVTSSIVQGCGRGGGGSPHMNGCTSDTWK